MFFYNKKSLLDYFLSDKKIESKEYLVNEKFINDLTKTMDDITSTTDNLVIIDSCWKNNITTIVIEIKKENNRGTDRESYIVHEKTKLHKLEQLPSFKITDRVKKICIHEKVGTYQGSPEATEAIFKCLKNGISGTKFDEGELVSKTKKFKDVELQYNKNNIVEINKEYHVTAGTYTLFKEVISQTELDKCVNEYIKIVSSLEKSLENEINDIKSVGENINPEIKFYQGNDQNVIKKNIIYTKIINVETVNNRRDTTYFQMSDNIISVYKKSTTPMDSSNFTFNNMCYHGISYRNDVSNSHNFCDTGRIIIKFAHLSHSSNIFISSDPRIDAQYKEKLISYLTDNIFTMCVRSTTLGLTGIVSGYLYDEKTKIKYDTVSFLQDFETEPKKNILKSFKECSDEFQFLVQKKQNNEVLKVTDNVEYDIKSGTLRYEDFSIKVSDKQTKVALYSNMDSFAIDYYRGNISEAEIINRLTAIVLNSIYNIMLRAEDDRKINVTFNGSVEVELKVIISAVGRNFYLNGSRINQNHLVTILSEITCYRDNESAKKFIKNITNLNLDVYIGITTGYTAGGKLYRFSREKRSKYCMLLGDTKIQIKGKKLIKYLYDNKQTASQTRVDDIVYECTDLKDYITYRTLIDNASKEFKEKSLEYLKKKVEQTNSKFITYITTKNDILDGILVKGSSSNKYVIAFNSRDSFVFMNPVEKYKKDNSAVTFNNSLIEEKTDVYNEGTYICMVDQSNIKSNVGYDTVVAKLMALNCDSKIASSIYNLADEIGDQEGEENE